MRVSESSVEVSSFITVDSDDIVAWMPTHNQDREKIYPKPTGEDWKSRYSPAGSSKADG
jgi:hypothetical protein